MDQSVKIPLLRIKINNQDDIQSVIESLMAGEDITIIDWDGSKVKIY